MIFGVKIQKQNFPVKNNWTLNLLFLALKFKWDLCFICWFFNAKIQKYEKVFYLIFYAKNETKLQLFLAKKIWFFLEKNILGFLFQKLKFVFFFLFGIFFKRSMWWLRLYVWPRINQKPTRRSKPRTRISNSFRCCFGCTSTQQSGHWIANQASK